MPGGGISKGIAKSKATVEQIDRKHDVPYLAGQNRAGGKTYIDRSVPKTIPVGGKQLNPSKYLHIHEQVEHDLMDRGKSYSAAHKVALKHERAELQKDGISWDQYQRTMYDLVKKVGTKQATKPPADLDTRPYPPDVLIDKLGMRRGIHKRNPTASSGGAGSRRYTNRAKGARVQ